MGTNAYTSACLKAVETEQEHHAAQAVHLTPRQREVLALLCEGLPNKTICRRLNISSGTVKAHIAAILRELGVSSRLQAVIAAHRAVMIDDSMSAPEHIGRTRHDPAVLLRIY